MNITALNLNAGIDAVHTDIDVVDSSATDEP